ncbi:hypothetical protein STEG23_034657 [Scotinomys teguina]
MPEDRAVTVSSSHGTVSGIAKWIDLPSDVTVVPPPNLPITGLSSVLEKQEVHRHTPAVHSLSFSMALLAFK